VKLVPIGLCQQPFECGADTGSQRVTVREREPRRGNRVADLHGDPLRRHVRAPPGHGLARAEQRDQPKGLGCGAEIAGPLRVSDDADEAAGCISLHHIAPVDRLHNAAADLADDPSVRRLLESVRPDAVIHCAAFADLDACEDEPDRAMVVNARASEEIAGLAAEGKGRFVLVSTDMVFDGRKGDYREDDPTGPINTYGCSKVEAEKRVMVAHPEAVVARSALVYGKPMARGNSFSEKILEKVLSNRTVSLYTDQIRTPVLVTDLARALLDLAGGRFSGIVHLGGSEKTDRYAFGLRFAEIRGFPPDLLRPATMDEFPTRTPRPRDVSLNTGLARKKLKLTLQGYWEGLRDA
jgi:dTDP-4-dehydrorhamnose reductase